jgi:hypothetical protein
MKQNKLTKLFLKFGLILGISLAAHAQQPITAALTNGVNLVRSGGTALFELQITDTSGVANTITILDNSSSTTTNIVRPAYISAAYTTLTNSTVFTNQAGVTQTNNFRYLSRSSTTNAAATNSANVLYRTIVPANGTVSILPAAHFAFGLGLQILAVSNAIVNGTYAPLP